MKKQIVSMLCGAVALAISVPAFAVTTELSGRYLTETLMDSVQLTDGGPSRRIVAQRFLPKVTMKVNDYVTLVYGAEIENDWGVNNPWTYGGDGAQPGDGVNIETKHMYSMIKVPGQDITVTTGLQPMMDGMSAIYFRDDTMAVIADTKFGPVNLNLGWTKISEGAVNATAFGAFSGANTNYTTAIQTNDDTDIYFARAAMVPAEGSKVGLELYWRHNQNGNQNPAIKGYVTDIYTIGLTGATKVGPAAVNGFLAFQNGTINADAPAGETDVAAMAASVEASMKFNDNLSGALRLIYFGNDDSDTEQNTWINEVGQFGPGSVAFVADNQPIFLSNGYKIGQLGGWRDQVALANLGYGLFAIVGNVSWTSGNYFAKGSLGYYSALSDERDDTPATEREGTTLGFEACAQVGMKVAEAATLSVRGSYAALGNFYDKTAPGLADPDNMYTASLILDIPFN